MNRLVCHACGYKYQVGAAVKADCCTKPEVHVHNVDKPCERCADGTKCCALNCEFYAMHMLFPFCPTHMKDEDLLRAWEEL